MRRIMTEAAVAPLDIAILVGLLLVIPCGLLAGCLMMHYRKSLLAWLHLCWYGEAAESHEQAQKDRENALQDMYEHALEIQHREYEAKQKADLDRKRNSEVETPSTLDLIRTINETITVSPIRGNRALAFAPSLNLGGKADDEHVFEPISGLPFRDNTPRALTRARVARSAPRKSSTKAQSSSRAYSSQSNSNLLDLPPVVPDCAAPIEPKSEESLAQGKSRASTARSQACSAVVSKKAHSESKISHAGVHAQRLSDGNEASASLSVPRQSYSAESAPAPQVSTGALPLGRQPALEPDDANYMVKEYGPPVSMGRERSVHL
eukprot:gb/GEZN01012863.1/.p1 GENE.gb/GEZN01012863.1/~~gb/GEZN01012863.1/.p1  ORF type:complete len:321 (-),score=16.13 gb/GEZN01012863.1/:72-1034(-)